MSITIMANSLGRDIEIQGMQVVWQPGWKLEEMVRDVGCEGEGSIFICLFGIPDIYDRERKRVDARKLTKLEDTIESFRGRRNWVLCTFFPPVESSEVDKRMVGRVNVRISELNAANGNGTPAVARKIFWRTRVTGLWRLERRHLREDGVHWSHSGRELGEEAIRYWRTARNQREGFRRLREAREEVQGGREEGAGDDANAQGGEVQDESGGEEVHGERESEEEAEDARDQIARVREDAERRIREIREEMERAVADIEKRERERREREETARRERGAREEEEREREETTRRERIERRVEEEVRREERRDEAGERRRDLREVIRSRNRDVRNDVPRRVDYL
jgi:hypothetical protein